MASDIYKGGYLICATTTKYYQIFTDTGMALKNVGDYSEPVYSSYGAHIMQFTSAVTAGEVPYENAKEAIQNTLLKDARNAKFMSLLVEWQNDGVKITQYTDALNAKIEPEATATLTEILSSAF